MMLLSSFKRGTMRLLPAALVAAAIASIAATSASADGDAKAGRKKAVQCAACHGIDGLSKLPTAPNLAGQPAMYLEKELKAFRDGQRSEENMNVVAKPLTDADIADLAAWYASIEVSVELPK
ncbi:MAG TPA: cytochrome c [Xanthobacteraceae bacterium]|nr:cytochrome c [Xanthobacteraceae bacterium]